MNVNPLLLRRLQVPEVLSQRLGLKLLENLGLRGWVEFPDLIDELTFVHAVGSG